MPETGDNAAAIGGAAVTALNTDRDLLAQWVGEEAAAGHGASAARAVHAARQRFYLDMLRGRPKPAAPSASRPA